MPPKNGVGVGVAVVDFDDLAYLRARIDADTCSETTIRVIREDELLPGLFPAEENWTVLRSSLLPGFLLCYRRLFG
jgi:hypothetical protein